MDSNGSKLINQFFGGHKTIQKAYDFLVDFNDEYTNLKPFHVKNVQIPQGMFKADYQSLGAFSVLMPVLDSTNHFELRLTLEEDEFSTVQNSIFQMRNRMMDPNTGYVILGPNGKVNPSVKYITVELYAPDFVNQAGRIPSRIPSQIRRYKFIDCYLINVQEPTFDYAGNHSIDFALTFSCQYMEFRNDNETTKISTEDKTPVVENQITAPTTTSTPTETKLAKQDAKVAQAVRVEALAKIQTGRSSETVVTATKNVNNEEKNRKTFVKNLEQTGGLGVTKIPDFTTPTKKTSILESGTVKNLSPQSSSEPIFKSNIKSATDQSYQSAPGMGVLKLSTKPNAGGNGRGAIKTP